MQAQLFDLYRAGIRSAADMMKLSLEHTERLQQQQLQLFRQALDESTRSSAQSGEVRGVDDMVAFNSRLAGSQLERMSEFWANWWRAAGDVQKSLIEQFQSTVGHQMREGYSYAARAAEDSARLASQAANVGERERKEHRKSA